MACCVNCCRHNYIDGALTDTNHEVLSCVWPLPLTNFIFDWTILTSSLCIICQILVWNWSLHHLQHANLKFDLLYGFWTHNFLSILIERRWAGEGGRRSEAADRAGAHKRTPFNQWTVLLGTTGWPDGRLRPGPLDDISDVTFIVTAAPNMASVPQGSLTVPCPHCLPLGHLPLTQSTEHSLTICIHNLQTLSFIQSQSNKSLDIYPSKSM